MTGRTGPFRMPCAAPLRSTIARNNGSPVSNTHTFTIAATRAPEEYKIYLPLIPKNKRRVDLCSDQFRFSGAWSSFC